VIASDLRHYHELGLSGSIGVEPCPNHLPNGWNHYLKAKLLWDPSLNLAQLERRYSELFYGNCAGPAQRCLKATTDVLNAERDDAESVRKLSEAAAHFTAELQGFQKTPVIEERLKRIALWLNYITLRKEYHYRLTEKDAEAVNTAKTNLVRFVDTNRAHLAPHYGEITALKP